MSAFDQVHTHPSPPQPSINPNLLSVDYCLVKGGVGV